MMANDKSNLMVKNPSYPFLFSVWVFFIIVTNVPGVAVAGQIEQNAALAQLEEGEKLYEQGNLDEALEMFRQAIRSNPNLPEAHYALASAFEWKALKEGAQNTDSDLFLTEAVNHYSKVVEFGAADTETHRRLFHIYMQKHKWADAVKECLNYFWLDSFPISHFLTLVIVLCLLFVIRKAKQWSSSRICLLFSSVAILAILLLWLEIRHGDISTVAFFCDVLLITISGIVILSCLRDIFTAGFRKK